MITVNSGLKKIFNKFFTKEFLRYFVVGFTSVLLDISTLYCFKEFLGLSALLSVIINQLLIYNYVFLLNKFWVFSNKSAILEQVFRYGLVALFNYLVSIAWMWFFYNNQGFNYLLVRLSNIILAVAWNFLLYRFFVYKNKS